MFILAGCVIDLEPLTLDTQIQQALSDRKAMFEAQPAPTAPIALEEALARAISYNLQYRLTLMERALEDKIADATALDMLPKLTARAGMTNRSNMSGSYSENLETGSRTASSSTSQDQTVKTADLQLSWNVLDFGLSYFGAKVQANKILAAEERRRRVVLNMMEQTRAAWWEAATAERLLPEIQRVLADAYQALDNSRAAETQRLQTPTDALQFQKNLLEMIQQLETVAADLSVAKAQLAGQMNLPPGTAFTLATVDEATMTMPTMAAQLEDLEAISMVLRPEIREEGYLARNAALETRMSLIRLLPGAQLFAGLNWDSNSYLVHNEWASAGMQVSWNLLNVLTIPRMLDAGEAKEKVAETRRQALRMTVLTQVNVAWYRFERAARIFSRASELQKIESRMYQQSMAAQDGGAQSDLQRIRAGAANILASRARDRAFAEMQNAYGAIFQAAGIDPFPHEMPDGGLSELAKAIADAWDDQSEDAIQVPDALKGAIRDEKRVSTLIGTENQPAATQPGG